MVIRSFLGVIIALTATIPIRAAEHGFVDRTLENADGMVAKYTLFIPHGYTPAKATPVILFLHGAGEIGTDGKKPLNAGIAKSIREREKSFPALVVIPQATRHEPGILPTWQPGKPAGDRALAILAAVENDFKTDPKRTYLTGISMGGFGTWSMAARYPDKWAAIVPICGGGDRETAKTIKDIPCWCFSRRRRHDRRGRQLPAHDRCSETGRRHTQIHRVSRRQTPVMGQGVRDRRTLDLALCSEVEMTIKPTRGNGWVTNG